MKRLLQIAVFLFVAAVIYTFLPIRPVARLPKVEKLTAPTLETAYSLPDLNRWRILSNKDWHSTGNEIVAISVYVEGHPVDRLAKSQGLSSPTEMTLYFDGWTYIGATSTAVGLDEFYDYKGRSAQEIDGYTDEQWQSRLLQDVFSQ